jgi:hypothetical protein
MKNVIRDSRRPDDTGLLDSERPFYAIYIVLRVSWASTHPYRTMPVCF